MGMKKLQVELDNPARSFVAGQAVTGRVIVFSKKDKKIEALTIKFFGKATVSWSDTVAETEGSGKDRRTTRKTVLYKNEEEYFNSEINLLGRDFTRSSSERREFPFSFLLPPALPSSYVGKSGQVYYYLEANLKKAGLLNRGLEAKILFTVNGILDLNLEAGTETAGELRKYKNMCCLCCRSGPVGFVLRVPRKGFVPGEFLRFSLEMSNQSGSRVKGVTLSLVQYVMFHARGNSMEDMRAIRKIRGPIVNRGDSEIWEGDVLQIPPIPPSRLANCSIIDVQYFLKVEMQIRGLGTNLVGEIPITIGTIPLRNTFQELSARNEVLESFVVSQSGRSTGMMALPTAPFFEGYLDLPPPSYAEAMSLGGGPSEGQLNQGYVPPLKMSGKVGAAPQARELGNGQAGNDFQELVRGFVPNYITYGWTPAAANALKGDIK